MFSLRPLIISFTLMSSMLALARPNCNETVKQDNQVEYKLPHQQIDLIGWTHPLESEMNQAARVLIDAATAAIVPNCKLAQNILDSYLASAGARLNQSNRVLKTLQALYEKKTFSVIGTEYSPDEWKTMIDAGNQKGKFVNLAQSLSNHCPLAKAAAEDVSKIISPELFFAKSKNGLVAVKPMESQQLKEASGVSAETLNFDPDKENLSNASKTLIVSLQDKIRQGILPTQSQIQQIVDAELNPALKEKLRRVLTESMQVFALVKKRNQYIAQTASSDQVGTVIVIGSAHVSGLADELDKICKEPYRADQSQRAATKSAP